LPETQPTKYVLEEERSTPFDSGPTSTNELF
jgi:hypothetical protein